MARRFKRGAFIALEGCDRSGKTTQGTLLVERLRKHNVKAELLKFPDRRSPIGKLIDSYLRSALEVEDHALHLLFTANRWEKYEYMKDRLLGGTTLIADRYSYSGIAFSAAKPNMDIHWCYNSEKSLLQPDLVFFLNLSDEALKLREGFGDERYENIDFQKRVYKNYECFIDENWKILDASKSIEQLNDEIYRPVVEIINSCENEPIKRI